jgi:DnaJ-class molecular chaperone
MTCPECHGIGHVFETAEYAHYTVLMAEPCPECNGSGKTNCCEGNESQPEADE